MMAAGTMVVRTEVTAIMDLLPLMSLGAGGLYGGFLALPI